MSRHVRRHLISTAIFWSIVLAVFGLARRWLDSALTAAPATDIALARPLSSLPMRLGSWEGEDVPVDPAIIRVAGTDDHINRIYRDQRSAGPAVNLYVGYTARPVTMLGHRPDVCYPANGWLHISTKKDHLGLAGGRALECLIHEFRREDPHSESLIVLNYYVLQGRHTTEWTDFWGPKWRRPNFARDPNYYVAQVQLSAGAMVPSMIDRATASVRRFAAAAASDIDALLPLTGGRGERGP